MSTAANPANQPRAVNVEISEELIIAHLDDGRVIGVPLAWSWRLSQATSEQRRRWDLIGGGTGIRWPDIDEDISIRGMLEGVPAPRPER